MREYLVELVPKIGVEEAVEKGIHANGGDRQLKGWDGRGESDRSIGVTETDQFASLINAFHNG